MNKLTYLERAKEAAGKSTEPWETSIALAAIAQAEAAERQADAVEKILQVLNTIAGALGER